MDKQQFREFLESVAEIVDMNGMGPNGRIRHRDKKKQFRVVVEVDEDGEEYEVLEEIAEHDPNLGIVVKSLKPIEHPCEFGCGRILENQITEKRLAYTPYKHYRTRCTFCHKYQSPIDGSMVGSQQIGDEFYRLKRLRDK